MTTERETPAVSDIETFEPEGRAIPYAVEGSGPGVVLIAGLGLNIGYLGALAHSVAQEDFRVVRIGSRRSTALGMSDLAQDVVDIMDALGIDHAWIGGHGFGGSIARVVAIEHHDRTNGVVLLGVEGDVPAVAAGIPDAVRDEEAAAVQQSAWAAPEALAAGVPVLVVQGTDDPITPPVNGEALRATAPELVSVVSVEGGRHMFPATHMGATSWAIEDYLDWD
jgi:pimeloyl-ACP methyl ester carboxylesterase